MSGSSPFRVFLLSDSLEIPPESQGTPYQWTKSNMRISFNNNLGMLPFLFSSRILFVNLNVPTYDKNKCTQVHIVALQMALYPSGESQNKQRIKFLDDDDDDIYIE